VRRLELIALHQVGLLRILPALSSAVIMPGAIAQELAAGRSEGYDLLDVSAYDWMHIRSPTACQRNYLSSQSES
jgi:predicted nucleic acid-binding protein